MSESTRERLIVEASKLFAERGFGAVSVRDVTGMAGANVASVSYYFGGKQGLVEAVHEVHLHPVLLEREAWLHGVSARTRLRGLLEGWMAPLLGQGELSTLGAEVFFELNRAALDHARLKAGEYARWRARLCKGLDPLVAGHLRGIAESTRRWRLHWALDALERSIVRGKDVEGFLGRVSMKLPLEDLVGRLLDFAVAGLAAPPSRSDAPAAVSPTRDSAESFGEQGEFGF